MAKKKQLNSLDVLNSINKENNASNAGGNTSALDALNRIADENQNERYGPNGMSYGAYDSPVDQYGFNGRSYDSVSQEAYNLAMQASQRQAEENQARLDANANDYSNMSWWQRLVDRVKNTIKGGAKSYAATDSETLRTLYEFGQNQRSRADAEQLAQYQKELERAKTAYNENLEYDRIHGTNFASEGDIYIIEDLQRKVDAFSKVVNGRVQQKATEKLTEMNDNLSQSANEDIERAKTGLGFVGGALVDVGTNATQMALDAASGGILAGATGGLSGLLNNDVRGAMGLAAMGARSFGGGAQSARLEGANISQQVGYGAAQGAVEVLTEKLFDGLAGVYGKGTADEAVDEFIKKHISSETGQKVASIVESMLEEGGEELISAFLDPLEKTIFDKGAALKEKYGSKEGFAKAAAEEWYDALIGALMGGVTTTVATGINSILNRGAQTQVQPTQNDSQQNNEIIPLQSEMQSEASTEANTQQTETVTSSNVSEEEQIKQNAKKLGLPEDAANILVDDYQIGANVDVTTFNNAVNEVFNLAKTGLEAEQIRDNGVFASSLTPTQIEHAVNLSKDFDKADQNNSAIPEAEPGTSIEEFSKAFPSPEKVMDIFNQEPADDVDTFEHGFKAAYDMGNSGVSIREVTENSAPGLTQEQRQAAFNLGRASAKQTAGTKASSVQNGRKTGNLGYVKGTVSGEGVTLPELKQKFNDSQNTAYRLLTRYAETTGANIVLYNSETNAAGNFPEAQGRFQWKDNTIYIDINSGLFDSNDVNSLGKYTMLRTFSHEFTHFIEKWNPSEYNEFREFVFNVMEENGESVNDLIEEKMSLDSSGKMTYEQASREVVADAMMDILPDSTLVQQLATEHKNIFKKLLEKLRQFNARLKQYYSQISTRAPREAEALKKNGAYMESVVKMWDNIAKGAVENYQSNVGREQYDQPAKPDNLPKRSKQQKNVRSVAENAQINTENAQNYENTATSEVVNEEKLQSNNPSAPVENTAAPSSQEVTVEKNAEKYTGVYNDLYNELNGSYRVNRNGLIFSYEKVGDRFESWRGGIQRDNSINVRGVPIVDARSWIWNGTQKTREDIIQTLVDVAQNNKMLDQKEVNTNGENENQKTDQRGTVNTDGIRPGDLRLLDNVEEGPVQEYAGERRTSSVSSERGTETGRSGDRPDAERNGRTRSTGSSESTDLRRDVRLTEEEQQTQKEDLKKSVDTAVETESTVQPKGNNYVIGDSLDLPHGSKARYKANVDAIRIVKQLESENRIATPAEQEALSKYVGWGGISEAFDEKKTEWSKEYAELKELLTEEEYSAARASTLNAHYTDISVIKAMYRGLNKLGFTGGRMLEPSSGVGNFVGAMPSEMSGTVKSWTMVELDNITGLIAKYLYPNADVRIQGFEKAVIPDNYMDVAIGNVPFGNFGVTDRTYPKNLTSSIHNYFFVKSLDKVRTGGIVMFITSSYTMNSKDSAIRKYIMKKADLLGAIRLPNNAFFQNAGTPVVTDILVLKKRAPGTEYSGETFQESSYDYMDGYRGAYVNEYFKSHPDMVLGTTALIRGMHSSDEYTVKPYSDRGTLADQIDKAFENINGKMDYPVRQSPEKTNYAVERAEKDTKPNGLVAKDGKVFQNDNGVLKEISTDEKTAKKITGMLGIRDAARELLNAQQQGVTENNIKAIRKKLNSLYDSFVKENGYLNSPQNKKAFEQDPDRFSLFALENYDAKKKTATKADIFSVNTVTPNRTITHVDTVSEGLIVSRNTNGGVDIALISRLTGKTADEVKKELVESELAFKNRDGDLEPAEVYLSGNVRAKLRDAQGLVGIDKDYQHNINALKEVVPEDIPHEQIYVQPGTPWIPDNVYSDFAAHILGGNNYRWSGPDVYIHRSNETGNFTVELKNAKLKQNYRNNQEWGTDKRSFLNLLEASLNSRSVTVSYKDSEGKTHVDETATAAANEKLEKIKEEFQRWLWEDAERTKDLEYLYNETFNALVTPKYNGSTLTVNGIRAGFALREHQANAVQRVISSGGNTLLAHKVGAGKTFEMAASAMKMKEMGIINKPMFAVPKSLVSQWGNEFKNFFPAAKLLVAEQSDFTPANRKTFANRISTGNYDAVIVSYEQFEKIPISDEFALNLYQEQINEIINAIEEAKEAAGAKSLSVKDLEKKRKQLQTKIDKLTDKAKDVDNISFEQLGIDSIFVDEAHNFKNLFYTTSMNNVSGLGNKDGSKRAFDLYTKVRYLQKLNNGRGIVFATATPVMNSMSEMYIMQKYLQPDLLNQLGLSTFDAWAKQFGEIVNGVEIKPSGQGYRVKQSFSRFKNLNELQLLFRNFSDVLTNIPGLKIPKMKGGKVKTVVCDPGEFQKNYMKELEKRAENIKNVDPSVDNMLKITSDGRKISYTQRMIDPSLPYEEGCKIYKCADNIVSEYKDSKDIKGTQVVFLDMATPKGKSNSEKGAAEEDIGIDNDSARLYDDLKARLVKLGIPKKEIAFIHDADTDDKKTKLFEDVNEGRIRVLIGSTGKMGVGMNAQKRIVAIHHLDAPWRPGDVEQRNGRAFRQGNINDEVSCYTYVTEGSFDARLWDILERKQSFIDQIMNGENIGRDVEDTGEVTLSAAEVKALASGNEFIVEQVKLGEEIKKLENLYKAYNAEKVQARKKLSDLKVSEAEAENRIKNGKKDSKQITDAFTDEKFSMKIGSKTFTDKKEAGEALMIQATANATTEGYTKIGEFAGLELRVFKTAEGINGSLAGSQGYQFKTYPERTTYMITRLQELAKEIKSGYVSSIETSLAEYKDEIAAQEKILGKPFEKQADLDKKRARYNEIMDILNPKQEQSISDSEDEGQVQYSRRTISLSSQEQRLIQAQRMQMYGGNEDNIPLTDVVFANDNMYVVTNGSIDRFMPIARYTYQLTEEEKNIAREIVGVEGQRSIDIFGQGPGSIRAWRKTNPRSSEYSVNGSSSATDGRLDDGMSGNGNAVRPDIESNGSGTGTAPSRIKQAFSSAATSLNQVASLFKNKNVDFGDINIDIGGGRFNATTEYLASIGTDNYVFDPFNRGREENLNTLDFLREGNRADTATCANVLNVIKEQEARSNVILEVAKSIKEDGTAYFSVYQKDKSGVGVQTGKDQWQNSRATADYMSEISEYFDSVERKGDIIIATNPKDDLPKAFWSITAEEEIEYSNRAQRLSNTEILSMAADELDSGSLTEEEKTALRGFQSRLDKVKEAQDLRRDLGQQYKQQQFTKGGSREEAIKIKNRMDIVDGRIKRLENDLLTFENKEVFKGILEKARGIIEKTERQRSNETLKQYRERRNESLSVKKYRVRVREEAETLRKWLVNPSNKDVVKHVPAEIQKTVADFLASINFSSKTALATSGLETTKADEKYLKNLKKMRDAIKANVEFQGAYSGYSDLPEDFLDTFQKLIDNAEAYISDKSGEFVVNQMSAADLKELSKTLRTLKKYITQMNMFHNNAMFQHAYEAGEETVQYLSEFEKSKKSGKSYSFMNFRYMRPSYIFERFGKGGQSIEHEFRDAQATQARLANRIIEFAKKTYTGKEVKEWSDTVKTFTTERGETIHVPITGIMSLYCLNKRNQARTHIYGDGIRIANFKDGRKVNLDEGHLVTLNDVQKMIGTLTDRQIEVADALQRFMNTECADWGNYVSMARFDVDQFTEDNYFPINSDGRYLSAAAEESPDNAGLYALLNSGFAKELKENANNRIILYNIFDVFANHTASMTQYRSFALPILDTLKWFNYKNEDTSVRDKLSLAFGAPVEERAGSGSKGYAESFVLNLLRQYNGVAGQNGTADAFLEGFLHKFNRAQVAFNFRVTIQQPMAITRAGMILDPAKLAKGLGMSATQYKKLSAEMEEYSGIAAWKSLGFYDTNISRGLTSLIKQNQDFGEKLTERGMASAEFADRFTWTAMWAAAKSTLNRSNYETEDDYMKAVSDLFDEVIYKTQVVDSVLTKSEMLKDKDLGSRILGSFMSEPSATMSMLTASFTQYNDAMQRGMSRSDAWQKYGKNIVKTIAVYAIGQILLAGVQATIDAWRDDDDFEDFMTKYIEAFKGNVVDELSPFGKIPFISDLYEALKYALDEFKVFDKLGLDMYGNKMSSAIEAFDDLYKVSDVLYDKFVAKKGYTNYAIVYYLVRMAADLSGLPVATAMREVVDIWNNTIGYFSPAKKILTYQSKMDKKTFEGWEKIAKPSGISEKVFSDIMNNAETDGKSGFTQDELGGYLKQKIKNRELTETQANAIFKIYWNSPNSHTYTTWKNK